MYPAFRWDSHHFDRLIGSSWVRKEIEASQEKPLSATLAYLAAEWIEDCNAFEFERRPYLLYE
jgi:hypothetical protein